MWREVLNNTITHHLWKRFVNCRFHYTVQTDTHYTTFVPDCYYIKVRVQNLNTWCTSFKIIAMITILNRNTQGGNASAVPRPMFPVQVVFILCFSINRFIFSPAYKHTVPGSESRPALTRELHLPIIKSS